MDAGPAPRLRVRWRRMANLRTRARRTGLLLLALVALFLLLELDQWLPGAWSGGGGFLRPGGSGRREPAAEVPDATPAPAPSDPTAVTPPRTRPPATPAREGPVVEVRGPDGQDVTDWRAGTGDLGPEDVVPLQGGSAPLRDARVREEGLRVRHAGRVVRHRHGLARGPARWVVHLPAGTPPRRRQPAGVHVLVRDPRDGSPVPGARVRWRSQGADHGIATDARGEAVVPPGPDGDPLEVHVQAPGRVPAETWASPRDGRPLRLDLPRLRRVTATFQWGDHRPCTFLRAEVRAADGRLLARAGGEGTAVGPEVSLEVPEDEMDGARLRLAPRGENVSGLRFDLPLAGLGAKVTLPAWRTVTLRVKDVQGRPVDRAQVLVTSDPGEGEGGPPQRPWRGMTNRAGELRFALPAGTDCDVLVIKGRLGPAARRLGSWDGSDVLDLVLAEGVLVPVRVLAPDGTPVAGAAVAGRGVVEGVRVEHGGLLRTDADGRVSVGPFAPGPVELWAHLPAGAWVGALAQARPAMGTVRLRPEPGRALRLVVEDPFGAPLQGVRVDVTVTAGGPPLAAAPAEGTTARTDAQGGAVLAWLPDRVYELILQKAGYRTQRVPGLRPDGALHLLTLLRAP
jgi:hypothetical protein